MGHTTSVSKSPTSHPAKAPRHPGFMLLLLASIAENKVFSSWLLGSFISGLIGLSGLTSSPLLEKAGIATFTAIQGAAVASAVQEKRIAAAEGKAQLNRSQFAKECDRLEADKADLNARNRELDKKDANLTAVEASLKTRADTYQDRILMQVTRDCEAKAAKTVAEARQVCQDNIAAKQAELDKALADKLAIQQEYGQMAQTTKNTAVKVVSDVNQKYKALGDKAAEVIATGNDVLSSERHDVNKVLTRLGNEIKAITVELAEYKQLVAQLQAPKHFTYHTFEAHTANDAQTFLSSLGLVLSCDSIGKIHYGLTPIYFEPIQADIKALKEVMPKLQLHLGLSEEPTVEMAKGKIIITMQLSEDKTPKVSKEVVIVNPPLSQLETAINASIHLRIVAQSGSGKTVLLGNLINYLVGHVSEDYVLSDPKATAPENWGNLTPTYYGRECLAPFFALTETCLSRIDEAIVSIKGGHGMPDFKPEFHVIDELEFLYGLSEVSKNKEHNSKLFKINAKSMLKVGREHKMKLLFVTQSPLPSDLNLRKNDFENCSAMFLGSQISTALANTDTDGLLKDVPREKIAQLKAEYKARLARGDEYVYLFFNPSDVSNPFLGLCPSLGHYAALKGAESAQTACSENPVFEGADPRTQLAAQSGATQSPQRVPGSTVKDAASATGAGGTAQVDAAPAASTDLSAALNRGTHCPDCGHHSNRYSKRKPNTKGNVSVKCLNKQCDRKTFSWKVI